MTVMGDPRFELRREVVLPEAAPVHEAPADFRARSRWCPAGWTASRWRRS